MLITETPLRAATPIVTANPLSADFAKDLSGQFLPAILTAQDLEENALDLLQHLWTFCLTIVDIFLHLDRHLNELVVQMGGWLYVLVFVVIFAETGLVVAPILPGDSLLFALGALSALDNSPLNVWLLMVLIFVAAILGDACNYSIGKYLGPKVFSRPDSLLLNKEYLRKAQAFYERHGGKTIIIARFVPIIRTFAPFVAGVGAMSYPRFALFNVVGALLWVPPFLLGGYFLGNIPSVKSNFHLIIVGIIVVSVLPGVIEFVRSRRR